MSSVSDWANQNTATVVPFIRDDQLNGGTEYGTPYDIACTWAAKREQRRDGNGAEYTTRYVVWTSDKRVRYRDKITLNGVEGSMEVRSVQNWDMSAFGEPDAPDFELGM